MKVRQKKGNRIMRILSAPYAAVRRTWGANGVLSRLFRQMLADLKITGPRFGALMNEYITDPRNGVPDNKKDQTSMRGNLNKEFAREQMTWKVLMKAMRFLQFTKVTIVFEATHRDGRKTLHSVDVDIDSDDFQIRLEQPPEMEAGGEHIPVLDHFADMEAQAELRATGGQPNPQFALAAQQPSRPQLSSQYWYVWSPKTLLVYETVGYLHPLKWHGELMARAKKAKVEKWEKTEDTVRMVRGDAITEAVGFYNDESSKPTGAAEVEHDATAK